MFFDLPVYRHVSDTTCDSEPKVLHTDGIIDIKITCIPITMEMIYFNSGRNKIHHQPLLKLFITIVVAVKCVTNNY